MKKPKGLKEIIRVYGNPKRDDYAHNLILIVTPATRLFPNGIRIYCHKMLVDDIKSIFAKIAASEKELNKTILFSFDGCFVKRQMRGFDRVSTHSWGIAIDVNASRNPLGAAPCQSQRLVDIFKSSGWSWGGDWERKDGMHFQACSGY